MFDSPPFLMSQHVVVEQQRLSLTECWSDSLLLNRNLWRQRCFSDQIQDHGHHTQAVTFITRATLKITVGCSRTPRHQVVRRVLRLNTKYQEPPQEFLLDIAILQHYTLHVGSWLSCYYSIESQSHGRLQVHLSMHFRCACTF